MTRVVQIVPVLAPADAVSGHARRLRDALRQAGYDSDIVAEVTHGGLGPETIRLADFQRRPEADLVVYQCSTGSAVVPWLIDQRIPFVVNYHNITPASFFEPWDPEAAANLRRARQQLQLLAPRALLSFADSAYNAAELVELGFDDVSVAPLLLPPPRSIPADPRMQDYLRRTRGGLHWLFVGRLAPNKCQHQVICALAAYREVYDPTATLTLVGSSACDPYRDHLYKLADDLGLGAAVRFAGTVSDAELTAAYDDADVFVCLSEHEGFCIPVVEAMHHGVPVVAAAHAAVPDTLGPAGLLLDGKDPLTVAAAVHCLLSDDQSRKALIAEGEARAVSLSPADAGDVAVDLVRRALAGSGPGSPGSGAGG